MTTTVGVLIRDLTDPDEAVRRYAAEDLTDLRDPAAVPALVAAIGDPSAAVREVVIDALAAYADGPTAAALLPVLGDSEPATRNAAREALRGLGRNAVGPLAGVVATGDRDARLFALVILASIGGPAVSEALATALRDPDANVAAAAAMALSRTGGPDAIPALAGVLVGVLAADPWVRCAVATGLGQIGGPAATAALLPLLDDANDTVVFVATQALGECGGATTLGPLAAATARTNPAVSLAALDAIDHVVDRLSPADAEGVRGRIDLGPLRAILAASDRAARVQAGRLLDRLSGPAHGVPPSDAAADRRGDV